MNLARRGKTIKPWQKCWKELVVGEPAKGDGSQAWVELLQGAGVLLVDCGGHHEHGVLHCDEVGDVHERLVHLGVRGDVVGGEEGGEVVDHVLGVVPEGDHGQHHLQPYCKKMIRGKPVPICFDAPYLISGNPITLVLENVSNFPKWYIERVNLHPFPGPNLS